MMLFLGALIGLDAGVRPAVAQHLAERYEAARLRLKANRLMEHGLLLPPRPAVRLPVAADSLRPDPAPGEASDSAQRAPAIRISERRVVRKLERPWFRNRFREVRWAFLGASRYFTLLDTTYTHELRARLQAHFGDPTQTVADFQPDRRPDDLLQFEYWLVVNDSIPVRISDVNGPEERGLIVSTDQQYRDRLFELRRAVLKPLLQSNERLAYVDYYFDRQEDAWYRTGFDGTRFFLDSISRRDLTPGRRPWIDSTSTREAPER